MAIRFSLSYRLCLFFAVIAVIFSVCKNPVSKRTIELPVVSEINDFAELPGFHVHSDSNGSYTIYLSGVFNSTVYFTKGTEITGLDYTVQPNESISIDIFAIGAGDEVIFTFPEGNSYMLVRSDDTTYIIRPYVVGDVTIQFEWSGDGLSLVVPGDTVNINRGDAVTFTAPQSFAEYEWYINGIQDDANNGPEFIFDSRVYPGAVYEIGLRAGLENGDSIIFVSGDAVTVNIINIKQEE